MSEDKLASLQEAVTAKRLSNSMVARITGKSASTVSQVLNGKYQAAGGAGRNDRGARHVRG